MIDTVDEKKIRAWRAERIRGELRRRDLGAVLVVDPINLRYATGTRNMQVWTMHNVVRYALVFAHGPTVLFDLATGRHLSAGLESVSEVRTSIPFDYMLVGVNAETMARRWARQIQDALVEQDCAADRLAVDRADTLMIHALDELGTRVVDGKQVLEHARAIKSAEEIGAFRASLATCEESVRSLHAFAVPGVTEAQAFGHLVGQSLERGGEYPETRLLTGGPRTNPWFQETSDRVLRAGDLLALDTDLIGPMGFFNDMSRSWVVGERRPTPAQATQPDISAEQLAHNIDLLRPGTSFVEFASKAFRLPDPYLANRYSSLAHGCGLAVEYPFVLYPEDADDGMYDGCFEANMIVCLESYVGAPDGPDGVKLEQPVLITDRGPHVLSELPLDARDF
ncbi:MAG: Xaa-Pro peptidase family protein [Rhodospirillales bacterium]|nr:Xaa-Pro peptidase family protein [Rhodospirillales bacterium]